MKKVYQETLIGTIRIQGKGDEFYFIEMIEDDDFKNGIVFNVKSNTGIDHYANGGGFGTIEKAIRSIKQSIKYN